MLQNLSSIGTLLSKNDLLKIDGGMIGPPNWEGCANPNFCKNWWDSQDWWENPPSPYEIPCGCE